MPVFSLFKPAPKTLRQLMKTKQIIPTEFAEQCALVEYLELKGLKFTSVPNSTYTKSWSQKRRNHMSGLRAGLCDMLVIVPRLDGTHNMVFLELKRIKMSSISTEQGEWVNAINKCTGVQAYIVYGASHAIKVIENLLKL